MSGIKKNLVFQGGGAKGPAEVFALSAAVDQGIVDLGQIERVAGTSAGAICASFCAFGMEPKDILSLMYATDFKTFMDGKSMDWLLTRSTEGMKWYKALSDAVNAKAAYSKLMADKGLCSGDVFRNWIENQIKQLVKGTDLEHKKNITFADLHHLVETQPVAGRHFADLSVIGSNVNTQRTETFSYQNTPNMCIADAIRISMSIPGVYKPWHRFDVNEKGERYQVNNDYYVDGGLHTESNFPINTFDQNGVRNPETMGFALFSPEDYANIELRDGQGHRDIQSAGDFFGATFSMLEEAQGSDRSAVQGIVVDPRAVKISTDGVGTLDFALTKEQYALMKAHAEIGIQEYREKSQKTPMEKQLDAYERKIDPAKAQLKDENEALRQEIARINKALEEALRSQRIVQKFTKPLKGFSSARTSDQLTATRCMTTRSLFSSTRGREEDLASPATAVAC